MILKILAITLGGLFFFGGLNASSHAQGWRTIPWAFLSVLGLLLSLAAIVSWAIPGFFVGGAIP